MPKYVYNPETLMYEAKNEPKAFRIIRIAALSLVALALVSTYFWLFTSVFKWDLPKTAILKRQYSAASSKVDLLTRQLDLYEQTLTGIEDRDDDVYRSIYGLSEVGSDERMSFGSTPEAVESRVADLKHRTYVQSLALDEVSVALRQAGEMVLCVPNVIPLRPVPGSYHLSSRFGYRTDPVYGGGEHHEGQDFASTVGNPVYATGNGIVVKTAPAKGRSGYGNEIVINHGYGYMTRYAHLNTIEVKVGQRVRRGDRIGSVGSTGKSTGPHLHYEVIYRGRHVNPMNYVDTSISLEEFDAMLPENETVEMKSSSEILGRR